MKKIKATLTALVMAFGVSAGLGTVAAMVDPVEKSNIVAQAETVVTINALAQANGTEGSVIYAYATDGTMPTVKDWDNKFTFVEGTGAGFLFNGKPLQDWEIKQPGDFYIRLGATVAAGDMVTLDGKFLCSAKEEAVIFNNCGLIYNGTSWGSVSATQDIGPLKLHVNSSVGGASGLNSQLYLWPTAGNPSVQTWDYLFAPIVADSFKINGKPAALAEMKSTGDGIWFNFSAVNAGDIVSVGGTYYSESAKTVYYITESHFQWNGSGWSIVYPQCNVGKVYVSDGDSQNVYLKPVDESVSMPVNSWDYAFSYVSGNGITVNGKMINMANSVKSVGNKFFANLGAAAQVGDILQVGGVFRCEQKAVEYVIEDRQFQWDGSAWVVYGEEIVYKDYNLGKMSLNWPSTAAANAKSGQLYLNQEGGADLPIPDGTWSTIFALESGDGLKVNDEVKSLAEIKSTDLGLFLSFGGVSVGDTVTISGTFICPEKATRYIVEESKFVWNGTTWEVYAEKVEDKVYNVGTVFATNDSTASAVYFAKYGVEGNFDMPTGWQETFAFEAGSGVGVTVNGEQINMNDIKVPGTMYVNLGKTAKVGDILAIGGTFYNQSSAVKYVIEHSEFMWNGTKWIVAYSDSRLADYDIISTSDIDFGYERTLSGTEDNTGLSYIASDENTTGSVKFRFGYNTADTSAGEFNVRLRGSAWDGLQFRVQWGGVFTANGSVEIIPLSNNTDYVIEFGAIDTADGKSIWTYIMVDGKLMFTQVLDKNANKDGGPAFSTFNTNHVSIYAADLATTTVTDSEHVAVTYTTSNGSFVEYANKNEAYNLISGRTSNAFVGWVSGGELYAAGETIGYLDAPLSFEAVEMDFSLLEGAAIRLANNADESGIRFTTYLKQADLNALIGNYGITNVSYGTLIIPYDYLEAGQAPNLEDFVAGETIIKIPSTYQEVEDGYLVYRGAMQKMYQENYGRAFAGRGYMEITFANGETMTVYTPFDKEDNVRSIRYVAQAFKADTEEYNALSAEKQAVVDSYAALDEITLMNYADYAANNVLAVTAWYYPELDSSNAYNNATNKAIAQKMKDAGIKAVYLDGEHHLDLGSNKNVEQTRQIIEFFWSQGLYTIAFGSNASTNMVIDYSIENYPDFAECEGFIGFLVWDEPVLANMELLAEFARNFNVKYAGTDATFMANLLPSYAADFNGTSNWWESSVDSLNKDAYKSYLETYCNTVLSQVQGEKWLSMDSYPVNADKSLMGNFLFDLAMLKYYAMESGAHAHAVLQSSGWVEGETTTKDRMPTEAEMRMQAYAAMAFGVDSISWWSYSDMRGDNQKNPTDNEEYYTYFANVNNELAAISAVYASFDWKGVILGVGKDNGSILNEDRDYEAYNLVRGEIGGYELSASDTKHLASVGTNKANWNYLMGVMQDMNGNEGYVLCNYNSHEADRAQTITLTFDSNITEVVIYRGGKAETVSVTNKTLAVSLATGEGVIILPSKLG